MDLPSVSVHSRRRTPSSSWSSVPCTTERLCHSDRNSGFRVVPSPRRSDTGGPPVGVTPTVPFHTDSHPPTHLPVSGPVLGSFWSGPDLVVIDNPGLVSRSGFTGTHPSPDHGVGPGVPGEVCRGLSTRPYPPSQRTGTTRVDLHTRPRRTPAVETPSFCPPLRQTVGLPT